MYRFWILGRIWRVRADNLDRFTGSLAKIGFGYF
jgi:hypothetical protein